MLFSLLSVASRLPCAGNTPLFHGTPDCCVFLHDVAVAVNLTSPCIRGPARGQQVGMNAASVAGASVNKFWRGILSKEHDAELEAMNAQRKRQRQTVPAACTLAACHDPSRVALAACCLFGFLYMPECMPHMYQCVQPCMPCPTCTYAHWFENCNLIHLCIFHYAHCSNVSVRA